MRIQNIYIKQTFTFRNLIWIALLLLLSLCSIWQETGFNLESVFTSINQLKIPSRTIVYIIRSTLPYLLFIYLFSVTNLGFNPLLLARIKNFTVFYHSQLLFSLILSILYWLIFRLLCSFVLILTAGISNQLNFEMISKFLISSASFKSILISLLSSLLLSLLFIVLDLFIRDKNITFTLVIVYILSNYISGLPLLSIMNAIQLPTTLTTNQIMLVVISQYIFVYFLGRFYINRRKSL